MKWKWTILYCCLLGLASCRKEQDTLPETALVSPGSVLVLNEGNYTYGNASVTWYHPDSTAIRQDLFEAVNNRPLGDVAQSMAVINGKGYLVVNNSSKIEVVNLSDFKSVATITGLLSPRYLLPVSSSKAYVTDIYADKIHILDLATQSKVGEIACSGWTEDILLANGKAWVVNYDSSRIEIIDPNTDQKIGSVPVPKSPSSMVSDTLGKLWVLSAGDNLQSIAPTLSRIDPSTQSVEWSQTFPMGAAPTDLNIAPDGQRLYYFDQHIYSLNIADNVLPSVPIINASGRLFYTLGLSPDGGRLYAADAIDYNQRGKVYVYQLPTLQPIDTFASGIIPGYFYFVQ
ncbi:MAG: YncE family protein [Chitinophagales bacterium]|nr:YncE family protein [Chitinophagales bacterium]